MSDSSANAERRAIERGWYYVAEPRATLPEHVRALERSPELDPLTRKSHGAAGHWLVRAPADRPWTLLLRAAYCAGERVTSAHARHQIEISAGENAPSWDKCGLRLSTGWLDSQPSRHHLLEALPQAPQPTLPRPEATPVQSSAPTNVLFFESLMNSDVEHNDAELSQGVLHMISALSANTNVRLHFARAKMPIEGAVREISSLESLDALMDSESLHLICITLLEGYWEGVVKLIQHIRRRGCRARIAVGGVMPTLTPEHVAAHLPEVSYVCRGAGEAILPELAKIIGSSTVDHPLSEEQLLALAGLRGLLALEEQHGQRILISARADLSPTVDDLSRVFLDLQYVEARHLVHGLEISTSRGCIHKCTFCNIIGRESYQARSTESIIELLNRYEQRFAQLFGNSIPHNAYRLHIADDDFACDKPRAATFFQQLLTTRFRLSSVQVSIADLCRKENGRLLPELDPELCTSILPECFADHHRQIPEDSYINDHLERRWSSYLQIGVETFSDPELIRLGKGYRLEHIQVVVHELAARNLHMDAYFIQSNSNTSAQDLLDGLRELVNLKLRYPTHFHVRFPAVKRLVSYLPGATYRRHQRKGTTDSLKLRGLAQVQGFPEYDYTFVDHDVPFDPWVRAAIDRDFFTGEKVYTASLEQLRTTWMDALSQSGAVGLERHSIERKLRSLDDLPRRLCFDLLRDVRNRRRNRDTLLRTHLSDPAAMLLVERVLGPRAQWLHQLQRYLSKETPRLVVIPTWQCELRCRYCSIPKQDGRVLTLETAFKAVEFLLSSERSSLILQFFGGEALLEWPTIQQTILYASEQAQLQGKELQFIISSNGMSLNREILEWLADYNVKLELSLDGDPETQNSFRRALLKTDDSYHQGIAPKAQVIQELSSFHEVIMVVHPEIVHKMASNFKHIAGLGFTRIQINYGLGYVWTKDQMTTFSEQLMVIAAFLRERWKNTDPVMLINLESEPMPMRLNGEITVDWDGSIHGGNAFLQRQSDSEDLRIGHVDELTSFDRAWIDMPENTQLLGCTYSPEVTANNISVGKIFASFIRWMRQQGIGASQHQSENAVGAPSGQP